MPPYPPWGRFLGYVPKARGKGGIAEVSKLVEAGLRSLQQL
jgi:hypothetical protein